MVSEANRTTQRHSKGFEGVSGVLQRFLWGSRGVQESLSGNSGDFRRISGSFDRFVGRSMMFNDVLRRSMRFLEVSRGHSGVAKVFHKVSWVNRASQGHLGRLKGDSEAFQWFPRSSRGDPGNFLGWFVKFHGWST